MVESLYHQEKRLNPRRFHVEYTRIVIDNNGLHELHPCYRCIVYKDRKPIHCDNCRVNPDKDRLRKAGLL